MQALRRNGSILHSNNVDLASEKLKPSFNLRMKQILKFYDILLYTFFLKPFSTTQWQ